MGRVITVLMLENAGRDGSTRREVRSYGYSGGLEADLVGV